MNVTITGHYDTDKETTIRPRGNHISKVAYQRAIKRMGLVASDYPVLVDDGPPIIVDPEHAIIN